MKWHKKGTLVNFRVAPLSDFQKKKARARQFISHSQWQEKRLFSLKEISSKEMGEHFQTVSHSTLNRFYNSVLRLSQK